MKGITVSKIYESEDEIINEIKGKFDKIKKNIKEIVKSFGYKEKNDLEKLELDDNITDEILYLRKLVDRLLEDNKSQNKEGMNLISYISNVNKQKRELLEESTVLQTRNKELEKIAHTDSLTGLNNARKLKKVMYYFAEEYKNGNLPHGLSIGFLDIDNFKEVNDTYGHNGGDIVLIDFSDRMKKYFGKQEFVLFRKGGEEFVVLSKIGSIDFNKRLNRFLEIIKESEISLPYGNKTRISFSGAMIHTKELEVNGTPPKDGNKYTPDEIESIIENTLGKGLLEAKKHPGKGKIIHK